MLSDACQILIVPSAALEAKNVPSEEYTSSVM
jgi:hypothetical protein